MAPGGPLNVKKIVALSTVMLASFALSGCSLSRDVASLDMYTPSDGVQVDLETLKVRNALFIAGSSGNVILIGSFVNSGTENVTATIQTTDGNGEEVRLSLEVPTGQKVDLGYNGQDGVVMALDVLPGSMYPIFVSGASDPVEMLVPVMNGALAEYRPFVELVD
jgi:hypothetical protein